MKIESSCPDPNLDLYASNNQTLLAFVEIMQSFFLMQNNYKRDWIGCREVFGALYFQKSALFVQYWMLP